MTIPPATSQDRASGLDPKKHPEVWRLASAIAKYENISLPDTIVIDDADQLETFLDALELSPAELKVIVSGDSQEALDILGRAAEDDDTLQAVAEAIDALYSAITEPESEDISSVIYINDTASIIARALAKNIESHEHTGSESVFTTSFKTAEDAAGEISYLPIDISSVRVVENNSIVKVVVKADV